MKVLHKLAAADVKTKDDKAEAYDKTKADVKTKADAKTKADEAAADLKAKSDAKAAADWAMMCDLFGCRSDDEEV